jgi:hypothetical protein
MEAHPGAIEAQLGALEPHSIGNCGVIKIPLAYWSLILELWRLKTHPGDVELNLELCRLTLERLNTHPRMVDAQDSPWSYEGSFWSCESSH